MRTASRIVTIVHPVGKMFAAFGDAIDNARWRRVGIKENTVENAPAVGMAHQKVAWLGGRARFFGTLAISIVLFCVLTACPGGGDLLDKINEKRVAHGCRNVSGDDQLRAAADRQAVDIRDHPDHFGTPGTSPLADIHTGTDGTNGGTRITAAGYSPLSAWGEIIYWAPGPPGNTEQATIDWWMDSPPHRAQIENCNFTNVGIGLLYPDGNQWIAVADFAAH
ncbi:CAP domain-containing protein [Nocardia sp. NPDC101769]|uniref:CAP domain-containing protein n=1 Tax=Nocardia sp. NPDC101769 TaxID=3364333 RepID=UPI00382DB3E8